MSFSTQLEQQYRELIQDKIKQVSFEVPEDIDLFCQKMNTMVSSIDEKKEVKNAKDSKHIKAASKDSKDTKAETVSSAPSSAQPVASLQPKINHQQTKAKYEEEVLEFKELVEEGFDLYVTDKVVDLVNSVQTGRDARSSFVEIPAFVATTANATKENKIKEARMEFKRIIVEEIKNKINDFVKMTLEQRKTYIANYNKNRQAAIVSRKAMKEHKAPTVGSEAHVLSEEAWLRREQERFAREGMKKEEERLQKESMRRERAREISARRIIQQILLLHDAKRDALILENRVNDNKINITHNIIRYHNDEKDLQVLEKKNRGGDNKIMHGFQAPRNFNFLQKPAQQSRGSVANDKPQSPPLQKLEKKY